MAWIALTCPQCSAPLPRVALWRSVKCESCGSLVTKTETVVTRDSFRQALNRQRLESAGKETVVCGSAGYELGPTLGHGEISTVYLGRRLGGFPLLATVKISSAATAAARFSKEAAALQALQSIEARGAGAYFSRALPQVIAYGAVEGNGGGQGIVFVHSRIFWGSLAALNERFPSGIDARHAIWIWRRMLEALAVLHGQGWCHCDIRPEHALVDPANHRVRLIGWNSATEQAGEKLRLMDLCRSARVIQVLLAGTGRVEDLPANVPDGMSQLVLKAANDLDFCRAQGAKGLERLLQSEARKAFGPPEFVELAI